ncbi:gamma-glutamyltranspeptidase Ggt2 [Schizosaccharomyces cryophilus OY26]|uniref:Glutathione hydrolase n=1 Tax=Schizosaccharomyces cryophilus (strain OY26 / ATCC MYA-4695 / CBS 11777 / NBRC 106824 / NRRL Y48691) TaxID=653667 RepID=S9VSM1_SCHCR|nr:gamma-glutamyltranspeptidase Ggt2 [Schizosaccharomyces cryophilus OY26]EPY50878.1 gamma-glutamyltranspeptidase Ggt2 [Schizosaccharomyces cryophilus OY26]
MSNLSITTPLLNDWSSYLTNQHDSDWEEIHRARQNRYFRFKIRHVALLIFGTGILALLVFLYAFNPPLHPPGQFTGHKVKGKSGAVATEVVGCSNIGIDILAMGGNAVDAAVASTLCIGGGGFMLIRLPNDTARSINFREMAPANASKHMFDGNPMLARVGALSIGVPGELAGLYHAWDHYGQLEWLKIVEPSIKLAREGFTVTPAMEHCLLDDTTKDLINDPVWASVIAPYGRLLKAGDIMRRPAFSKTLEIIAKEGVEPFYKGSLADLMVAFIQERGGIIMKEDFEQYFPVVSDAIETTYRGHDVLTCPLPTSGPALIEGLNILDGFPMDSSSLSFTKRLHLQVEAMKWLSSGRTQFGDPDFIQENLPLISTMMSKKFASDVRRNISMTKTYSWEHYNPSYDIPVNHGTTHIAVKDDEGYAVSLTSTVNLYFGSQLMDPVTGMVFNDEMDDFSIPGSSNAFNLTPSPWNYIEPYKRPVSSAAPTIISNKQGDFELVIGASGGSRIVTAVLDAIVKRVDMHYDIESMVASARSHHQLRPNVLILENGFSKMIASRIKKYRHNVLRLNPRQWPLSAVQAVMEHKDIIYGMSDPRKYGQAAAY